MGGLLEPRVYSLVLLRLKSEINVCGNGDVERAQLVGLISCGHNKVALGVAVQNELFVVLAPRHELQRIFIQYVVFRRLELSRVHIESNHGTDKGHADLFLPGLLRPAECDFDGGRILRLQL